MKILYVDFYHEYGNPSRGLNYIGIDGFEKALRDLGHDVCHFYFDEHIKNIKELNERLIERFFETSPDLVLFNLYYEIVEIETIVKMSSTAKIVNWFGDDPFLFERFTKRYAPHFTYCVTTDKYSIYKYLALGQKNVIYSQWPASCPNNLQLTTDYKYDVSFVGAKNPPREWFVNELRRRGVNIIVFGNGWPNGPIANDEMHNVFAKSKINLNISNSDIWDYRFLSSGYCSAKILVKTLIKYHIQNNRWFNKIFRILRKGRSLTVSFYGKTSSQIKARNFEIPCCGGLQLTDYVPSIEDYFVLGKEIICYSNVDEAEKLIKYYLREGEAREGIKLAGFKRAEHEYSYINTLLKVFDEIELIEKRVQ